MAAAKGAASTVAAAFSSRRRGGGGGGGGGGRSRRHRCTSVILSYPYYSSCIVVVAAAGAAAEGCNVKHIECMRQKKQYPTDAAASNNSVSSKPDPIPRSIEGVGTKPCTPASGLYPEPYRVVTMFLLMLTPRGPYKPITTLNPETPTPKPAKAT